MFPNRGQQPAAQDGQQQQGPCEQCLATMPAFTKVLLGVAAAGIPLYYIAGSLFANCPSMVLGHLHVWRLVTGAIIQRGILAGLFSMMTMFQYCSRVEYAKGSMYLFYSTVVCCLLINFSFFVIASLMSFANMSMINGHVMVDSGADCEVAGFGACLCSMGFWPFAFCIMVIETHYAQEEERRFMCFPCNVPTKYYPWILLVFFSLFLGFYIDMILGLIVGHIYVRSERLELSSSDAADYERQGKFKWLMEQRNFISHSEAGGDYNPFMMGGAQPQRPAAAEEPGRRGRTFGSGRSGNVMSMSDAQAAPSQPAAARQERPSVFSGEGHRLGGSSSGGGGILSTVAARNPVPRARPGEALAARMERMKRQSQQQSHNDGDVAIEMQNTVSGPRDALRPDQHFTIDDEDERRPFISDTRQQEQDEWNENLATLQELGYTKDDALTALAHAGGDLQGAVEYLTPEYT